MKVKSEREVTQVVSDSSDPMDYSLPASSILGIFQARVLEWGAIAFSYHRANPTGHMDACLWHPYNVKLIVFAEHKKLN